MIKWKDYYQILGVDPDCSQEEITKAYKYRAFVFHPDRIPEKMRRQATEDFKELNEAYRVLKDPQQRARYHSEWLKKNSRQEKTLPKPKPVIEPSTIICKNAEPGKIIRKSFTIRNDGGPYTKISFSNPKSWVRIVNWVPYSNEEELPLKVDLEIELDEWGKEYVEHIFVKLDEEVTQITIKLQGKPKPVPVYEEKAPNNIKTVSSYSYSSPVTSFRSSRKGILIFLGLVCLIIFFVIRFSVIRISRGHSPLPQSQPRPVFSFTTIDLARHIMGKNFLGMEETIRFLKVSKAEKKAMAKLTKIPFSEETLRHCKDTHVLVLDLGISILDLSKRLRMRFDSLAYSEGNKQAFARCTEACRWRLIKKEAVPNSFNKNWEEQLILLNKDEEVPEARQVAYMAVLYHLTNGEILFNDAWVRTRSPASNGAHVLFAYTMDGFEFTIHLSDYDDRREDDIGLSSFQQF